MLRRDDDQGAAHAVLIFGLGMLGSSIQQRLFDAQYLPALSVDFDWTSETSWRPAFQAMPDHCKSLSPEVRRISLVWTAGSGSFSSTPEETELENQPFLGMVSLAQSLQAWLGPGQIDIHYMSSAGGLFESQRIVGPNSAAAPLRPYGEMKLRQEQRLLEAFDNSRVSIYRPSSVYGPMVQKERHGLINNLVNNGARGRTTVLDAHVMSLRDYVYFADIGNFVAKRIASPGDSGGTHFLVSSRCASIREVVHIIERVLRIKLHYRYDVSFGNHSNITFSDRILPEGWSPSTLEVGIRQFVAGRYANLAAPSRAMH